MPELSITSETVDLKKSRMCRDIFLTNLVLQGELGLLKSQNDDPLATNSDPMIPSDRTALEVFLEIEDERGVPRFRGPKDYSRFLQEGLFVPGVSSVRISCAAGFDQHYLVGPDGLLAGKELDAHAGKKGFFHYTQLIGPTTLFSPSSINRAATYTVVANLTGSISFSSDDMVLFLSRVS